MLGQWFLATGLHFLRIGRIGQCHSTFQYFLQMQTFPAVTKETRITGSDSFAKMKQLEATGILLLRWSNWNFSAVKI